MNRWPASSGCAVRLGDAAMPGGESASLNPEFLRSAEFKSQGQDAGSRQSQCSVTQTAWGFGTLGGQGRPAHKLPRHHCAPFVIILSGLLDCELSSERKMFKEERGQEEEVEI